MEWIKKSIQDGSIKAYPIDGIPDGHSFRIGKRYELPDGKLRVEYLIAYKDSVKDAATYCPVVVAKDATQEEIDKEYHRAENEIRKMYVFL